MRKSLRRRGGSCIKAAHDGGDIVVSHPQAPALLDRAVDELVGSVVRPLPTAVGSDSDSDRSERKVTAEWVPLQPQGEARIAIICED